MRSLRYCISEPPFLFHLRVLVPSFPSFVAAVLTPSLLAPRRRPSTKKKKQQQQQQQQKQKKKKSSCWKGICQLSTDGGYRRDRLGPHRAVDRDYHLGAIIVRYPSAPDFLPSPPNRRFQSPTNTNTNKTPTIRRYPSDYLVVRYTCEPPTQYNFNCLA